MCLPDRQLGLICGCISGAVILRRKPSPFRPRSLCQQLEGAHGDVMRSLCMLDIPGGSHLTPRKRQDGHGKAGKERALSLTQKTNAMAVPSSSRKQSVRQPRVSADSGLLCSSIKCYCLPLGFMVILTPYRHPARMPVHAGRTVPVFLPNYFPLLVPHQRFLKAEDVSEMQWCWRHATHGAGIL